MESNKVFEVQEHLEREFTAPLMAEYVNWILMQAADRKINTLYFLARDGYSLLQIARALCEKRRISIECRYLYCSRAALRMPTYHLIGDEALDLLLTGGYQVTLGALLDRPGFSREERDQVKADCGLENDSEDRILTACELDEYRKRFEKSKAYCSLVQQKSQNAYAPAIAYFRQEGLLDTDTVAIVDSGWSGSMQRSLRQLLQSAGFRGDLIGFYFGMYKAPVDPQDGTYLTYLFDPNHNRRSRVMFNNNLFECLLSAPHGMTVGYQFAQPDGVQPVLRPSDAAEAEIKASIQRIVHYVLTMEESDRCKDEIQMRRHTESLIHRYMVHPTAEEAAVLGNYAFCDDITEGFHYRLAEENQIPRLKQHLLFARMVQKLPGRKKPMVALYWPYGTIAFLPKWKRWWYRWNIYTWEWLRVYLRG